MKKARYKILPEDNSYYGEIPDCSGVWANAPTLEECRQQLEEVLEDWILISVYLHHKLPIIDGIDINVERSEKLAEMS